MLEAAFANVKRASFRQRKGAVPLVGNEARTPPPCSGSVQFSARIRPLKEIGGQSRAGAAARGAAATTEATFPRRERVRQRDNAARAEIGRH
jgi:hypothetical protein